MQSHPKPLAARTGLLLTALLTGLLPLASPAQAAEPLERELVRQAPKVVHYLKEKGYKNVGILKFLVAKDRRGFSDNVGTLNLTLARQLEVALLLANDPHALLGIIRDASAVAARTPGANHLSRAGREKLFQARYPLFWGKQEVEADAFVTGAVQVGKDLRTLTVSLFVFGKDDNRLHQIVEDFTAANDPGKLGQMGESFVLRGAFDEDQAEGPARDTQVLATAERVKARKDRFPLACKDAPVTLEVLYDGQRVPLEFRAGRAWVPEPAEGQKVAFVLKRDDSRERYGVVLKVNGENTIGRERLPDSQCRKWVLDPGDGPVTIRGYQLDNHSAEAFRVLSREESARNAVNYGADVGTVTLTVFRELRGSEPAPDVEDEGAFAAAVARAKVPEERPENYHALKAQLLEESNRGLIAQGERIGSRTRGVQFKADPTPIMSVTIVYYHP